jgi:hypothetical protein
MPVSTKKKVTTEKRSIQKPLSKKVYREVITSSPKKISITLPNSLVGKTLELFALELKSQTLAKAKKTFSRNDFWETFGSGKNSLISVETLKNAAWRKHQW